MREGERERKLWGGEKKIEKCSNCKRAVLTTLCCKEKQRNPLLRLVEESSEEFQAVPKLLV